MPADKLKWTDQWTDQVNAKWSLRPSQLVESDDLTEFSLKKIVKQPNLFDENNENSLVNKLI